ncbi:MAG: GrpB family protein [Candidatus Magasanikbacteria bacterium]|nr:GrpB family protein [Candidatus Magasanikbacteria bacterium]
MLTSEQKKWLDHLSDTKKISVVPYDSKIKEVFKMIKAELIKILGKVRISHRGSTFLKISGQGEIDLYIPVNKKDFNVFIVKLSNYLGEPGSLYEFKRARFVKYLDGIKIEIFVINRNDSGWKNSIKFEKHLKNNPKALQEYEKLKIKANGLSVKEYYTLKTIFINKILSLS